MRNMIKSKDMVDRFSGYSIYRNSIRMKQIVGRRKEIIEDNFLELKKEKFSDWKNPIRAKKKKI